MPDKKLTDKEIVKTLECCSKENYNFDCENCPYHERCKNNENIFPLVLDLINRQQAEKAYYANNLNELTDNLLLYQKEVKRLVTENERLKELLVEWKTEAYKVADEKDELYCNAVDRVKTAKAEAYKKFAEKYTEELISALGLKSWQIEAVRELAQTVLKKMVGDKP